MHDPSVRRRPPAAGGVAVREELLTPTAVPDDAEAEVGLRPRSLEEFVGQAELKESIRNFETNIGPKMAQMFPPEPKK